VTSNLIKEWAKDFNRYKVKSQIAKKHINLCYASLVRKENVIKKYDTTAQPL
jgi:hypothetical protein